MRLTRSANSGCVSAAWTLAHDSDMVATLDWCSCSAGGSSALTYMAECRCDMMYENVAGAGTCSVLAAPP